MHSKAALEVSAIFDKKSVAMSLVKRVESGEPKTNKPKHGSSKLKRKGSMAIDATG